MSKMLECICCQCAEHLGQFKDYLQCTLCDLYGSEDEFADDSNKEVCCDCIEQMAKAHPEIK